MTATRLLTLDPGSTTGYAEFQLIPLYPGEVGHWELKTFGTVDYADLPSTIHNWENYDDWAIVAERAVARGIGASSLINADACSMIDNVLPHVQWILAGHWKPVMENSKKEIKDMTFAKFPRAAIVTHEWDAIRIGWWVIRFNTKMLEVKEKL